MSQKILSAAQLKYIDAYTIEHEPISSIELMEHAATVCFETFLPYIDFSNPVHVFCGSGNNGGDGFVIARFLSLMHSNVQVWFVPFGEISPECHANKALVPAYTELTSIQFLPEIGEHCTIIDALLGLGTTRSPEGLLKEVIERMNESGAPVLSVDLPSGLPADEIPEWDTLVKASFTVTFQQPKLTFFLKETIPFVGKWECVDIGLDQAEIERTKSRYFHLDASSIEQLIKPRDRFSHKGTYGHGLLIAGSKGKMGSAVLAAKAALRSGIGLLTVHLPEIGLNVLQTAVPEAMCSIDQESDRVSMIHEDVNTFSAIGIGPGIGTHEDALLLMEKVLQFPTVVIDADGLNLLAKHPTLLEQLPKNTILTPHPKEFERLAGSSVSTSDRLDRLMHFAQTYQCTVILKDAITAIATKDGMVYFNTTGNPGMATGGTGDVLTGIILGLLAQGYSVEVAAKIAVYYHGKAGDTVATERGQMALIAGDLIDTLMIGLETSDSDIIV